MLLRKIIRKLADAPAQAIMALRHNHRLSVSGKRIKKALAEKRTLFLELGAGAKTGVNGWMTLDIVPGCDIYCDLRNGIPFPNASVEKIYASHVIEHLTFREGQQMLDECLRVLKPGGVLSLAVPNARIYIDAYVNGRVIDDKNFFKTKSAYNNTTMIDYVNFIAYMDGHHKYMFDEENLIARLQLKGFKNARLRGFDPDLDQASRDYESIYADAEKSDSSGRG